MNYYIDNICYGFSGESPAGPLKESVSELFDGLAAGDWQGLAARLPDPGSIENRTCWIVSLADALASRFLPHHLCQRVSGETVDENGDESGLRVEILSIVHHSRRRYRQPKWTGKRGRRQRTC